MKLYPVNLTPWKILPLFTPKPLPPNYFRSCKVCSALFSSQKCYVLHLNSHTPKEFRWRWRPKETKCARCGYQFAEEQKLLEHLEENECTEVNCPRDELTCHTCGVTFPERDALDEHYVFERCRVDRTGKRARCGIQPYSKMGVESEGEKNFTSNQNNFVCPVYTCRRSFSSASAWGIHAKKIHTSWNGLCILCGEKVEFYKLFDHLTTKHSSSGEEDKETNFEENVVRIKTEVILEDDELKSGEVNKTEAGLGQGGK